MSRKTHSTRPWWWAFFLFFFFFGTDLSMWRLREELTHTHGEAAENEPKMGDALLYTHTRSRPCSVREIVILVYLAQVKVSSRLVEKTKKTELRMVRVGEGFVFSLSLSLSLSCLLCFLPYSPGCVSDCWATELATSSHAWPSGQQTAAVVECV